MLNPVKPSFCFRLHQVSPSKVPTFSHVLYVSVSCFSVMMFGLEFLDQVIDREFMEDSVSHFMKH